MSDEHDRSRPMPMPLDARERRAACDLGREIATAAARMNAALAADNAFQALGRTAEIGETLSELAGQARELAGAERAAPAPSGDTEREALRAALRPFAELGPLLVELEGEPAWSGREQNGMIRTWMGPSDFRAAYDLLRDEIDTDA